jgi:predicted Zn-dependent protease
MSQLNWSQILGWDEEQIEEIRITAFLYIREGKYDVAKYFCEALAVLNPENPYDISTLGALYLQLNNPVSALSYLDKAKVLDPDNKFVQINRIKAMLELGYKEEGMKLLKAFIPKCKDRFIASDAEALMQAYSM